jgi:sialate O-acetylesterase
MIPRQILPRTILTLALFALAAVCARADVKLHNLFTDHMVLQRDIAVPVWGWDHGEGRQVDGEARQAQDGRTG